MNIGVRGGWRRLQLPQSQKFLKFFGQNADDSGKRTREKTFKKEIKARLVRYFHKRLSCQNVVKVKWSKRDPQLQVFCYGKAVCQLNVYRGNARCYFYQ